MSQHRIIIGQVRFDVSVTFMVGFGKYVTCHVGFGRNPTCLDGVREPLISFVAGFSKPLQLSGLKKAGPTSLMVDFDVPNTVIWSQCRHMDSS